MRSRYRYDRQIRKLHWMTVAAVCAAIATIPSVAAARIYLPPGKSGASEYYESIPSSGGNVAPPSGGSHVSPAALDAIGQGRRGSKGLSHLGSTGTAALGLARATAPGSSGGAPSAPGGSALSGLAHLVSGSDAGGIGVFLPLLLAISLLAALTLGVFRLRRRGTSV